MLVSCHKCGQEIDRPPCRIKERNFCSRACMGETVTKVCEICRGEYRASKSRTDSRYCSMACFAESKKTDQSLHSCGRCGTEFWDHASANRIYCSARCSEIRNFVTPTQKRCKSCGIIKPLTDFTERKGHCRTCIRGIAGTKRKASPSLYIQYCRRHYAKCREKRIAQNKAYREANPGKVKAYRQLPHVKAMVLRATKAWQKKYPQKAAENEARRRAVLKQSPVVEKINRTMIIRRDAGICYLCGQKPTGSSITLDHIVPLKSGGHHTAANLKVACRVCNSRKGAKPLSELSWPVTH